MSNTVLETLPSEYDYFQSRAIQAAITQQYDQSFGPIGALQPGAPIEIHIPGSDTGYRDLNNSRLEVRCRITTATGGDIPEGANVGPVNLLLHSMFANIEMDICGRRISDSSNFYPYRAFFETFLSYTKEVQDTRLDAECWKKDTVGSFDNFEVSAAGTNEGFKARAAKFSRSNSVVLFGRPHLDLFHQDKDIPPKCPIFLRLIPAQTNFFLKKAPAENVNYQLEIQQVRLWVRTKELSPSLQLAHEQMLLKGNNIRIPYTRVNLKHLTIPAGVTSMNFDNIYQGVLPTRLLLAFVRDDVMNGGAARNPFRFENLNLSYLQLSMNGEGLPRIPYQPNFETDDYIREYFGLLETLNIDIGNRALDLTPQDWASTYPFFMFTTDPSGYPTLPRSGFARLELQFRTATARVHNVICFAEFPSTLELDKYHNALF